MFGLALRLTLRGGREPLARLVLTMLSVAIGASVLISLLGGYHATQAINNRPDWEGTSAMRNDRSTSNANVELWNYGQDTFQGRTIERLYVAALGPHAPVVPGIPRLPSPGQYYASPALISLMHTTPADQLSNRFPGSRAGTMGERALSSPNELVAIVGLTPARVAALPNTVRVNHINSSGSQNSDQGAFEQFDIYIGGIVLLIPMIVLISTATRLAAARREERYAAMRLVGATPGQVSAIASIESMIGALLGTVLGIGIFILLRPAIASTAFTGSPLFVSNVTLPMWEYIIVILGVPLLAAGTSLWSLRRVQISPLGVAHKVTPPAPKVWTLIPFAIGVLLFVIAVPKGESSGGRNLSYAGLIIILLGLLFAGSWLTLQASRLYLRFTNGTASLLAARRLADNPRSAFRTVSGLILAVFVGTAVATAAPAFKVLQHPATTNPTLNNVLSVPLNNFPVSAGITPRAATALVGDLNEISGAAVIPVYANPAYMFRPYSSSNPPQFRSNGSVIEAAGYDSVVLCASLHGLSVIGACQPGATTALAHGGQTLLGNTAEASDTLPIVHDGSPVFSGKLSSLHLGGLLINTNTAATLEKVRTALATFGLRSGATYPQPRTYSESAVAAASYEAEAERYILLIVMLTLVTAACSLAVSVGGSIMERKRPFTLLRLSGTSISTLYNVVALESLLPFVISFLVAASTGFGIGAAAIDIIKNIAKANTPSSPTTKALLRIGITFPSHSYYVIMGIGLAISCIVILVTSVSLLKKVTQPDDARFE